MGLKVGDKVQYVPNECHALQPHHQTGDYPWTIGRKKVDHDRDHATGKVTRVEHMQEMEGKDLKEFVDAYHRHTNKEEAHKTLHRLRPCETWDATVTAVHGDGTVTVAIASNQGGVTLNYRVPVTKKAMQPHTVCAE